MNFQQFLMVASFCGLIILVPMLFRAICDEYNFHPLGKNIRAIRAMSFFSLVIPCVCFLKMFVYGSTKTNTPPAGTPPMTMAPRRLLMTTELSTGFTTNQIAARAAFVRAGTNEVWNFDLTRQDAASTNAHVLERWRLRGAANERVALGCATETVPPLIDGERIAVDTFGRITTGGRTFSPLGIQVGMVPEARWSMIGRESLAWWTVTASNTTVVTWANALLNRDTNTPVSVQAEFFDDGRFFYRYDLSSLGADASNIVAKVYTEAGEERIPLGAGITSNYGHLLGEDDGSTLDKDDDGLSTYDEIFLYGTDPDLPDTDGDGRGDGEEVWSGDDPLMSDVTDAEILGRIAGGATNETVEIVWDELESTKLWDGFAFHSDVGTNALFTRTFEVDRRNGWTSCFLSGRGEEWCCNGEDAIQDWTLYGAAIEWSDNTGLSGTVTESPRGDSLYLPVSPNATSVTITLRATEGGGRHASPTPIFFLVYTPRIEFPGSQGIAGDDGNTYSVYEVDDTISMNVNRENRPCHAGLFEGEATEADYELPSGAGVYPYPTERSAEDSRPYLAPQPLMMAPRLLGAPNDNGGKNYLVIISPWVTYGTGHYACWHEYPYDWGWLGGWCDCTPEVGSGIEGEAAVNAYIDYEDSTYCVGVVEVGGTEVWRGEAYHEVWACDHEPDDPDEGYCPCGCGEDCEHCNCANPDGPSQGSIRFRIGLGHDDNGQREGFAWFESDGPLTVTPQTFEFSIPPNGNARVWESGSTVGVTTYSTNGRDLTISPITNGVIVTAVGRRVPSPPEMEGNVLDPAVAGRLPSWEITNVDGSPSVVRLVKRSAGETPAPQGEGAVLEDWTYSCRSVGGGWTWDVTDNLDVEPPREESVAVINGTNFVFGADGKLQRLSVWSNDEEIVVRTISYDGAGRVALVDDGTNGCVTFAYDAAGRILSMTGPEGTLTALRDENGSMTNLDTSAWNGPIPTPRPGPLMAPRPRLLGSGGEMSAIDALRHYHNGGGTPVTLPFGAIDTSDARPLDFGVVRRFVSHCHEPGDYPIVGTNSYPATPSMRLLLGDVGVELRGTITYHGNCNWSFSGTMSGVDDPYDFNAANRSFLGEMLTAIGRLLFDGDGTPYVFQFSGSQPLTGTGHCGDK